MQEIIVVEVINRSSTHFSERGNVAADVWKSSSTWVPVMLNGTEVRIARSSLKELDTFAMQEAIKRKDEAERRRWRNW